jgi:hypothetical protein
LNATRSAIPVPLVRRFPRFSPPLQFGSSHSLQRFPHRHSNSVQRFPRNQSDSTRFLTTPVRSDAFGITTQILSRMRSAPPIIFARRSYSRIRPPILQFGRTPLTPVRRDRSLPRVSFPPLKFGLTRSAPPVLSCSNNITLRTVRTLPHHI